MANEDISNSLQIVFDGNNNVNYDSEQTDNTSTVRQPQQDISETETEEGKEAEDNSRKFRGVNWDDYSTNHLLDIYQHKFPLLESTPHNKGRKQIYEEVRNEFNSNEDIRNKRTLKSMTRKWGEMLAKYRIRRGVEERTGKLPDTHWDYHDRMHEIVGHLPTNGRFAFPITNTVVDPATNQLTTTTVSAIPITNTSNKNSSGSNSNSNSSSSRKRTRSDDIDNDTHNDPQHHHDNNDHGNNSESDDAIISSSESSNINSITPHQHPRPIQPKATVPCVMSISQQQPSTSSSSSPSSKQFQTTSHPAKVPRRIEPKRNTISNNESNNDKGKGAGTKETAAFIQAIQPQAAYKHRSNTFSILKKASLVSPSPPPSTSEVAAIIQNEHGHDIRNTIDQILEAGERLNELMAAESNSSKKSISDSLSLIADSSKQMAESNRLLAQQIENNTKTTAALLEAMKALVEGMNHRNLDGDRS